jgi:hypothetical protein
LWAELRWLWLYDGLVASPVASRRRGHQNGLHPVLLQGSYGCGGNQAKD